MTTDKILKSMIIINSIILGLLLVSALLVPNKYLTIVYLIGTAFTWYKIGMTVADERSQKRTLALLRGEEDAPVRGSDPGNSDEEAT